MKKKLFIRNMLLLWIMVLLCVQARAGNYFMMVLTDTMSIDSLLPANIVAIEYFIDTDPGFGYGTAVNTALADTINMAFDIPMQAIPNGLHTIYFRAKDDKDKWSITHWTTFMKMPDEVGNNDTSANHQNITQLEYFIDADPGFGNGTAISTTIADSINLGFDISMLIVPNGLHTIYFRAKDDKDKWSITHWTTFMKMPDEVANNDTSSTHQNITQLEYFIDTDPGFGNGTAINTAFADTINIGFDIPMQTVPNGLHTIYFRAKDDKNKWSITHWTTFMKMPDEVANNDTFTTTHQNITQLEYFIDTDPGFGNGTAINTAFADTINMAFDIPMQTVPNGLHTIYFRAKDDKDKWSITHWTTFMKMPDEVVNNDTSAATHQNITQLEYFIDTDPGFGNGTAVSTVIADTINIGFDIPIQTVPNGLHTIYFRAKDDKNKWSLTHWVIFMKMPDEVVNVDSTAINKKITQVEYYFDTDPGFGNGIAKATADSIDISQDIDINLLGVSYGMHTLYVRAKDDNNHWSLTHFKKIPPMPAGEITGLTSVCQPIDSILYTVPPIYFATSYIWTLPNGYIGTSDTNFIWINYSLLAHSGSIRVKGHNEVGDGQESSLPITVHPLLNTSINPELNTFCAGESMYLNAVVLSGGDAPRYQWYLNNLPVSNDAAYSFQPQEGDSVYCTVVSDLGCLVIKDAQTEVKVYHQGTDRTLRVKLFLEGLFDKATAIMHEAQDIDFNTGNVFPMFGAGTADKIDIEVHQGDDPYSTFLSQNNVSLSTTGFADLVGKCEDNGNYYISIKSRNHLETWSAMPVPFNTNPVIYDFTTSAFDAYQAPGGNDPQIQLLPGIFAFYLGDLDQSLSIDFDDFNLFEPYMNEGIYGFTIADFNGNGLCDFDDFNLFEPRLNMGPFTQYPGMMK